MKKYYFLRGEQRMGPFTVDELKQQDIDRQTWIWFEGLEKWTRLNEITELIEVWSTLPPPVKSGYESSNSYQAPPPPPNPSYGQQNTSYGQQNTSYGPQNVKQHLSQPMPKSWLTESILVTLLCCLPFGIAGIVNASKVESRYHAGDVDGAYRASAEAKKWTTIGFWLGIAAIIIYVIVLATAANEYRRY